MLKEIHDQLLAEKPEDAQHDEATCPFCNGEMSDAVDHQGGSEPVTKTYTEDEYDSVLAKVSALEAKLAEFEGAQQESEVEAKIAEIKAEAQALNADLQTKLDTALLEAEAAKSEKEKVLEYLTQVQADADKAAEIAARRDERIALVKEQTSFPESRIEERADAWAAMDEAAFTAALDDWKTIAPKTTNGKIPDVSTALSASRDDQASTDALREVLGLRDRGIDARAV